MTLTVKGEQERLLRGLLYRITRSDWSDRQNGNTMYRGDGQWRFATVEVGVTPEEVNAAFTILGLEPVGIKPRGECATCAFSYHGKSRGWEAPCSHCAAPSMSEYKPAPHAGTTAI